MMLLHTYGQLRPTLPAQTAELGLRSSHFFPLRPKPLTVARSKHQSVFQRNLIVAAADGQSNTGFAIEAPGTLPEATL